jgi:hypothetical protein
MAKRAYQARAVALKSGPAHGAGFHARSYTAAVVMGAGLRSDRLLMMTVVDLELLVTLVSCAATRATGTISVSWLALPLYMAVW